MKDKILKDSKKQRREACERQYPDNYWKILCAVDADLRRVFENNRTGWGYEEQEYYQSLGKDQYPDTEKELVQLFEQFMGDSDSGLDLQRFFNLHDKTKAWLRKRCNNWKRHQDRAKKALAISGTTTRQLHTRLAQLTLEILNERFYDLKREICHLLGIEDNELDLETTWRIFFLQGPPYTNNDKRYIKVRKEALKAKRKELEEEHKYLDRLEPTLTRAFPWKWIQENQSIMENLSRKGNRHFLKMYDMLMEQRIRFSDSTYYFDTYIHEDDLLPVLVKPIFPLIEKETGCDTNTVRRYIREMAYQGIIRRFVKDGERGQVIFEIGRWIKGNAAFPKPVWFLKNTPEIRQALKDFDANRSLKKDRSQK